MALVKTFALANLSDRLKLAYLFVSHDLNVVRAIADRVYVK